MTTDVSSAPAPTPQQVFSALQSHFGATCELTQTAIEITVKRGWAKASIQMQQGEAGIDFSVLVRPASLWAVVQWLTKLGGLMAEIVTLNSRSTLERELLDYLRRRFPSASPAGERGAGPWANSRA